MPKAPYPGLSRIRASHVVGLDSKFCPLPSTQERLPPSQMFTLKISRRLWLEPLPETAGIKAGPRWAPIWQHFPKLVCPPCSLHSRYLTPDPSQPVPTLILGCRTHLIGQSSMRAPQPPHKVGMYPLSFYNLGYNLLTTKHMDLKNRFQTLHLNCL